MSLIPYMLVTLFTSIILVVSSMWILITILHGLSLELKNQMAEAKKNDSFILIALTVLSPFIATVAYLVLRLVTLMG